MIFTNLVDAHAALRDWALANYSTLDEGLKEATAGIFQLGVSPVDTLVNSAEMIYAKRDDLGDDIKQIGSGIARFCADNGFHGLNIDQRGYKIADLLEGKQIEGDAPAAKDRYGLPPVPPAPPAPTGV